MRRGRGRGGKEGADNVGDVGRRDDQFVFDIRVFIVVDMQYFRFFCRSFLLGSRVHSFEVRRLTIYILSGSSSWFEHENQLIFERIS